MVKYWIAGLIIGIASLLIGYCVGIGRARALYKLSVELVEIAESKLINAKSLLTEASDELEG